MHLTQIDYIPEEHHELGFNWLINHNEAALFAGMGLGKTGMTLRAILEKIGNLDSKGFLIVSPLRVTNTVWGAEIEKFKQFDPYISYSNLRTKEGQRAFELGNKCVYLINYEQLPRFSADMLEGRRVKDWPFDSVVFDELSVAKNHKSKRINSFRKFSSLLDRRWGLTGTPSPNGYIDLFAPTRLLDNGKRLGKGITAFRDKYFDSYPIYLPSGGKTMQYGVTQQGKKTIESKLSDLALTLRSEDWLKIPETDFYDVNITLPPKAREHYNQLEDELITMFADNPNNAVVAVNAAVLIGKLLQICGGFAYTAERGVVHFHDAKIKALKKILKSDDTNFLVVCQFKHEMRAICEAIPELTMFHESKVSDWNKRKIKGMVCHPRSMGHGLNLQSGGEAVAWYNHGYSSELYLQVNARLARMGQKFRTRVYRLIGNDTADEAVLEAVRNKLEGQNALLHTLVTLWKMRQ